MNKEEMDVVFKRSHILLHQHKHAISAEKYTVACNTIEHCHQWNRRNRRGAFLADDLYAFTYNEDTGSIFQYAECEHDENEEVQAMWELLLCILLAVVCIAYQREGQLYVPQDIETIKTNEVRGFLNLFVQQQKTPCELCDYFYNQVCY